MPIRPNLSEDPSYDLPRMIHLTVERRNVFLPPQNIVSVRAVDKVVMLFTLDGKAYRTYRPLGQLLLAFPGFWVRTSRGWAVLASEIHSVSGGWVYLKNGERMPCSRRQATRLRDKSFTMMMDRTEQVAVLTTLNGEDEGARRVRRPGGRSIHTFLREREERQRR